MKRKLNMIFEKIVNVLIGIVVIAILFCIYNFISLKILKNDYVNIFGYSFFEVATGSMSGAIEEGDAVIIKLDTKYEVNDIVTYKSGKDFITHRIIEINDDYVITKGDANNTNDNPIDKQLIIGKVVKTVSNVKTLRKVILNPKVIVLVFITLFSLSLLFSYNGKNIKIVVDKEEKPKKEKKFKEKKEKVIKIKEDIPKKEIVEETKEIIKEKPITSKVESKKSIEVTQVIDINKVKDEVNKKKKKIEYTQVIDVNEVNKQKNNKKKKLEYTQVINLKDIEKQKGD